MTEKKIEALVRKTAKPNLKCAAASQARSAKTARLIHQGYPMKRRRFLSHLAAVASATLTRNLTESGAQTRRRTRIAIDRTQFLINGQPTYKGRVWRGNRIEGLLMNARLVQTSSTI